MFRYWHSKTDTENRYTVLKVHDIALAVLDGFGSSHDATDIIVIEQRLYEHMTGKKPIDGKQWQENETNQSKTCPLLLASRSRK